MIEVLAPVASFDALKVAVYNGANAVYLGLDKFNARMKAENFTLENISTAINFAHIFNVKVYVVVNIVLKQSELKEVEYILKHLDSCNVDAIIIQDLSIIEIVRKNKLKFQVHASTQLGVSNLFGAKVLEKLGFSRVVLARETTIEDIKQIKQNTKLEIEYFVHGAMCVSYSGSCLFSSLKTKNSGNRGECLQNCRKLYKSSITNKTEYYLSIKDQALVENINDLINSGVDSFKIEGRMRSLEYLKSRLNLYVSAINNEDYSRHYINSLISFNRGGFSKGYNYSSKNSLIYSKLQSNMGFYIGNIEKITKENNKIYLYIKTKSHELLVGDGVKVIEDGKEIFGFNIDKVEKVALNTYKVPSIRPYKVNSNIYLTTSKALKDDALNYNKKMLPIDFTLFGEIGSNLMMLAKYNDIEVTYKSEYIIQKAEKHQDYDQIYNQIRKLNETNFVLNSLDLIFSESIFIPNSILSKAKREIVSLIELEILDRYKNTMKINHLKDKCNLNIITDDMKDLTVIVNEYVTINKSSSLNIVYEINNLDDKEKLDIEKFVQDKHNVFIKLPIILRDKDIKLIYNFLNENNSLNIYVNNISHLGLALEFNRKVIIGEMMNILNDFFIKVHNIKSYVNSLENDYDSLKENAGVLAIVRPHLMHFAHCPVIANTNCTCATCKYDGPFEYEDKFDTFKIYRQKLIYCQFVLLNSHITNILTKPDAYNRFKHLVVDLTSFNINKKQEILNKVLSRQIINLNNYKNELGYKGLN